MLYLPQKSGHVNFDEFLNLELAGESEFKVLQKKLDFLASYQYLRLGQEKERKNKGKF
jgi:hypothetical protein